jgi:putative chitobiose transport system substrate-binding protein
MPILLGVALSGCSREQRDPSTIELWTLQLSPTFDEHMHSVVRTFEETHEGVKVVWTDVPYEGFTQKFISALSAGEAPDVVNLPADLVRQYVRLDALAPLDTLLPEGQRSDYHPAAMQPMRIDSALYGVPWYLATKILIADSAALVSAGIEQPLPSTFDGILKTAQLYRDRTGRPGFFFNLVVDSYLLQVFESEGVPILTPDGTRAAFATPKAVRILEQWLEAFQRGALPRESLMAGHQAGIDLYQSGAVPMFLGAPQFLRLIAENAPNRLSRTTVAPAPVGRAGWKELDVMALAVTSTSRNRPAAAALAAFVTSAGPQIAFSKLVPVFPSVRSALDDPFFSVSDGSLTSVARQIGADQLATARVLRPSIPHYPRLREIFKEHMLTCFLGRRSPADALAFAQAQWNEVLAEP